MSSHYYYVYFYFPCLCLYLHIVSIDAANDIFFASTDSFDYLEKIPISPAKISKWKTTTEESMGSKANPTSEGQVNGQANIKEARNSNDFIKESIVKVLSKRDKTEKNTIITLSAFGTNSSKSLSDAFKNLNEYAGNVTSNTNIDINMNTISDSLENEIYLNPNKINLETMWQDVDVVGGTTENELTAEDRYPNYVHRENPIHASTVPHLNYPEPRHFNLTGNNSGLPETGEYEKTQTEDLSRDKNQESTFIEHLELPDDKFTTVKANQEIIHDATNSNVTLQLVVLGESFKAFLGLLNSATFRPNAQVTVHDNENMTFISISALEDLHMYEGSLDSKNRSYVCGSIVYGYFTGIFMLDNGTVWYVERPENSNNTDKSASVKETYVSFQNIVRTNDSCNETMFSGCKRDGENKITCFECHRYWKEKSSSTAQVSLSNSTRSHINSSYSLKNASCTIELASDPSHFVEVHNRSILHTLRELLTVILQANRVLNEMDFDGDGKPENVSLRIGHVAMYASYVGKEPARKSNESFMDHKLETLLKHHQNSCLSLLFLSKNLTDEEPTTITYGGSICQSNADETRPPTNGAVVNVFGPKNRSRDRLAVGRRVTETIGQMMGSEEKDCEGPFLDSSGDSWLSYFPDCTRRSMSEVLGLRGSCLETVQDHRVRRLEVGLDTKNGSRCGNGIVDSGEECDCGKDCQKNHSCCVPSGNENECQYDRPKGHECDWSAPCCTMSCKLVPKEWKQFCGSGDPSCGPKNAYCDGNSPTCPHHQQASNASDGHRCGPGNLDQVGAATCKDGRCESTVCKDAGLEDCRCEHQSRKTCKICCKKKQKGAKCLPAKDFGLKSNDSSAFFYRYPGLPCSTVNNEFCDSMGACTSKLSGSGQADCFYSALTGKGMPATVLLIWTVLWRVICFRLV